MAQQTQDNVIFDAVELPTDNGFDALAEAVTLLLNTAMLTEREERWRARPGDLVDDDRGFERRVAPRRCKNRVCLAYRSDRFSLNLIGVVLPSRRKRVRKIIDSDLSRTGAATMSRRFPDRIDAEKLSQ